MTKSLKKRTTEEALVRQMWPPTSSGIEVAGTVVV